MEVPLKLISGLIIGFAIGLTGIGGGVLVMPTLTVLLGLPTTVAVGTASLFSLIAKSYAVFEHFRLKTVHLQVSLLFLAGAVPGNIVTGLLINRHVNHTLTTEAARQSFQGGLKQFVAYIILLSIVMMLINMMRRPKPAPGSYSFSKKILGAFCGVLIGVLIGATSVGGGVFVIPLLVIFFGLTSEKMVGTSIFIAVILTLVTSIIYGRGGQMDYATAVLMFGGSVAGIFFGSRLAVKLPDKWLKGLVVFLMVFSAVLMLANGPAH